MARENQGLQIALIIFVMLTIILGVTTYLFFRQSEEAFNKAKQNQDEATKKTQLCDKANEDADELKRLIGAAKTDKIDAVAAQFNEDMKTYGGTYPDAVRFYRPLLAKLSDIVKQKSADLVKARAEIQEWTAKYEVREASKDPQIKDFQASADKQAKDLAGERSKFKGERDRIAADEAKLQADLQNARKESATSVAQIQTKYDSAIVQVQKLTHLVKQKSEIIDSVTASTIDVPNGEIRWVNQRNNSVWINLGRADALSRQITFSVYPADITDLTAGGKKASIEVTQILGDHLAEARVIDDKISDPIMPGDKIHTPVWSPGEQKHFALAGVIDVDGDGKSDLQTVKNLITMNGGVVDCYMDDKGKRFGDLTVNTRYLVLGEPPNPKGQPALMATYSKIIGDADRLGIKKMPLQDVLQQMGWKNQTHVVRFGRGANPQDFRAKPEEGAPKKSTGSVSDVFKPRQPGQKAPPPPAKVPSDAY